MRGYQLVVLALLSPLPSAAVECTTVAGNLVSPCGFESQLEVDAWTLEDGISATFTAGAGEGATGSARIDAEQTDPTVFTAILRSPCTAVGPNANIDGGFAGSLVQGGDDVACVVGGLFYSDGACTTAIGPGGSTDPTLLPLGGAYVAVEESFQSPPGALAFTLRLLCFDAASEDFVADFDNGFAVVGPGTVLAVPALDGRGLAALAALLGVAALVALHRFSR